MKFATVSKPIRVERAVGESVQPSFVVGTMETLDGKVVGNTRYSGDPFDPGR
jgi:hypothetical protein